MLKQLTASYNRTYHSAIRRAPITVSSETRDEVWATQNLIPVLEKLQNKNKVPKSKPKKKRKVAYKYKIGDHVRLSHLHKTFERGHDEKFTGEIFKVNERF